MHSLLLLTHSLFRYFILVFLIVVIVRALNGWLNNKPFSATDNKIGLWLLMITHMQLLLAILLYFVSPLVIFSGSAMKDPVARYWLVEHITLMLVAIALITLGRILPKKQALDIAKHKRIFIFNFIALLLIVAAIASFKDRGFFNISM
jgi:hypothetical protein